MKDSVSGPVSTIIIAPTESQGESLKNDQTKTYEEEETEDAGVSQNEDEQSWQRRRRWSDELSVLSSSSNAASSTLALMIAILCFVGMGM